jgi:hypothetical protein
MISALLTFLLVALVLLVVYIVIGKFIGGAALQIVGLILGIALLIYALRLFNIGL